MKYEDLYWQIKNNELYHDGEILKESDRYNNFDKLFIITTRSVEFNYSISRVVDCDDKIHVDESLQLKLIQQFNIAFYLFKNPTKKSESLHKLLWEI